MPWPDEPADNARINVMPNEPPKTGKSQLPEPLLQLGTDWFALGGLAMGTIVTVLVGTTVGLLSVRVGGAPDYGATMAVLIVGAFTLAGRAVG